MAMGTRKIGPAIAAGCTSVIKPAKQTPLSMFMLAKILEEAGLPAGALNVVTAKSSRQDDGAAHQGPAAAQAVLHRLDRGRPRAHEGRLREILKMSMELGGNAPFIVFEDADLDAAVDGAMLAKMRNVGEACTSANRFHVARGRRRRVRPQARRPHGRAEDRARLGGRRRGRPAHRRRRSATRSPSSSTDAVGKGAKVARRRRDRGRPRLLLQADRAHRHLRRRRAAARGDLRPGRPGQGLRDRGGGDRGGQRHGVRARRLRLHPRPVTARSASRRRWRPACSASTRASCPTPARRSAA